VAALAWVGKRRYLGTGTPNAFDDHDLSVQDDEQTAVRRRPQPSELDGGSDDFLGQLSESLREAHLPGLPIGPSADNVIDEELVFGKQNDGTSGAALFSEREPSVADEMSLQQIWDTTPRSNEERTHRSEPADPSTPSALDELLVGEATRTSALPLHPESVDSEAAPPTARTVQGDEDEDPNEVQEDDLDVDSIRHSRR